MRFLASFRLTRSFITVAVAVATAAATATVVASLAAPALASTDTTLISNLGQTQQPEHWESVGPEDSLVHAQALKFTTGNNAGGYSLASVTAWLKDVGSNNAPQVSIYTLDEHGLPEEILYTLNNPTTFANDALNTFTVPADGVLAKETGYFVVFENSVEAPTDSVLYRIGFVDGNSVDANGAAGWSIATDEDYTVLFKIEGSVMLASDTQRRSTDQPGSGTTKTTVVTVPQSLSVTTNDQRLTVEWGAATDDGAKSLTGYRIQWKAASANWPSASEAEVSAGSQAYTITSLTNGTSYDVRVAAEYDGSPGTWSTASSDAPQVVVGAPKNLEVRGPHDRLKVFWQAPDRSKGHTITGYLVEWKSGNQSYDTARQWLVTEARNSSDPLTVVGVEHGVVNVVRVSTMSDATTVGSSVSSVVPVSAKSYIENNIIQKFEDDFPWVRQAWSNRPLPSKVKSSKRPGWYVYYTGGVDGFRGLPRGLRFVFTLKGYRSEAIVLHEIAHHFTLDPRVPDVQDAVGVGWLYFNYRVKGHCQVGEIYPDVLTSHTRQKARALWIPDRLPRNSQARRPRRRKRRGSRERGEGRDSGLVLGALRRRNRQRRPGRRMGRCPKRQSQAGDHVFDAQHVRWLLLHRRGQLGVDIVGRSCWQPVAGRRV